MRRAEAGPTKSKYIHHSDTVMQKPTIRASVAGSVGAGSALSDEPSTTTLSPSATITKSWKRSTK